MAKKKTPKRVIDGVRAELEVSQVLAHGQALCAANGRPWGGFILLFAVSKTRKSAFGLAALATIVISAVTRLWP